MIKYLSQWAVLAVSVLWSLSAAAHTGVGTVHGFVAGLMHPMMGLDHLFAMLAVGLWAVYLGGRAMPGLPLAFIGLMSVGAKLGFSGYVLPHAELGVTWSVVVFGVALWRGWSIPTLLAGAMTASFAVFHGYVHAAEAGQMTDSTAAYLYGFLAATALLHGVGVGLGCWMRSAVWCRQAFGLVCTGTGLYWLVTGV
ncbi:MAG: HupE/UreJ family protein [Methylococcaceae bacterium]